MPIPSLLCGGWIRRLPDTHPLFYFLCSLDIYILLNEEG